MRFIFKAAIGCTIGLLPVLAFFFYTKRYRKRVEPIELDKDWIEFGVLFEIISYPLDGGIGISLNEANCRKQGLAGSNNSAADRDYIAVTSEKSGSDIPDAVHHLKHPELSDVSVTDIIRAINCEEHIKAPDVKLFPHLRTVYYLAENINVIDIVPNFVQTVQTSLCQLQLPDLRICHFPDYMRHLLMNKYKSEELVGEEDFDKFLAPYWPYTLINFNSFLKLRNMFDNDTVFVKSFRPHLVIGEKKGARLLNTEFCENKFVAVKIGDVVFSDINPCTHTDYINSFNKSKAFYGEPYETLSRTRGLKDIHPELGTSNKPVFGINMRLSEKSLNSQKRSIRVGDKVYVKYSDSPSAPKSRENPSTSR